jgi:hypothetical protein
MLNRRAMLGREAAPGRRTDGPRREAMDKIRIEQHSAVGLLWVGGWFFTVGFLHLTFWKGVLAAVVWPYYLGVTFSSMLR